MSSPSNHFECHWQASRLLVILYALTQLLAVVALLLADLPVWAACLGLSGCALHAWWVLPRQVLLTHPQAFMGLRRSDAGWQLYSAAEGWQPVQLRPDSLALPMVIVLRFRIPGRWGTQSLCIPRDALARDAHRRLRVRLKFSRRRWAAVE